jgi:hypothetical protein
MAASRKNTKIFLLDDSAPSTSALDRLLQKTGQPFEIIRFPRCTDLISCIEKLKREELPTSFILDSYGEDGLRAAKLLIQHYQDCSAPLPFICFTSSFSDVSSGVCQKLLGEQPNLRVNFTEISPSTKEVELISALLEQQTLRILPCCYGLREFLNLEFGLNLSLDVDDSLHAREYRDLRLGRDQKPTTLPQLLQWLHQQHNLPTQALYPTATEILRRFSQEQRCETSTLPSSLFFGESNKIDFHCAVGRPAYGPIAFSLEDIKPDTAKPILVLSDYPSGGVLSGYFNHLAGVVVISPEIADHVEYTLKENRLNGLLGCASSSPFFEGDSVQLGEYTLRKGDWVHLRNSLDMEPPPQLSRHDVDVLGRISSKLQDIWHQKALPVFAANESGHPHDSYGFPYPVGLFRSEALASESSEQMRLIAKIIQGQATPEEEKILGTSLFYDYRSLASASSSHSKPFCFRLFDFRIQDHFPHDLHPTLARKGVCQGDEALAQYPELYALQLEALVSGFVREIDAKYMYGQEEDDIASPLLDVMMPSLRTAKGVETFIQMVDVAAKDQWISRGNDYRIGVMLEQKELCEDIERVAPLVDFIKIGSNDLTASVLGISRGDTKARSDYRAEHGFDPFHHPAPEVFDEVLPLAIEKARRANPQIEIGLCGDHAQDPRLIAKLFALGVKTFSVSPASGNLSLLPPLAYLEVSRNWRSPC